MINKTFKHETSNVSVSSSNNQQLKELFESIVSPKLSTKAQWVNDDEVIMEQDASIALHSFLLKAERLGKNIEYVKQTVIKIVD